MSVGLGLFVAAMESFGSWSAMGLGRGGLRRRFGFPPSLFANRGVHCLWSLLLRGCLAWRVLLRFTYPLNTKQNIFVFLLIFFGRLDLDIFKVKTTLCWGLGWG